MGITLNEKTVGIEVLKRMQVKTETNKAKVRDVEDCAWLGREACEKLAPLVNNAEDKAKVEVVDGVPEWKAISLNTVKTTISRVAGRVHNKIDGKGICDRETSLVPRGMRGQPFTVLEATVWLVPELIERAFTRTQCSTVWISSEEADELRGLPAYERNARALELAKDRKVKKISLNKIITENYSLQVFIKPDLGDIVIREQVEAPIDAEALANELFD